MSESFYNGSLYLSNNVIPTTSILYFFGSSGDTISIQTQRSISNATNPGCAGELCLGKDSSSGITYLYYCVADNTWQRVALSTW